MRPPNLCSPANYAKTMEECQCAGAYFGKDERTLSFAAVDRIGRRGRVRLAERLLRVDPDCVAKAARRATVGE